MKLTVVRFVFFVLTVSLFLLINVLAQTQTNITAPAGSVRFGSLVVALPNGNIVVTDPSYSIPSGPARVGAAYLYNGSNGALISTLTGSNLNDFVGGSVTVLSNGNYVISSIYWDGGAADVGAVTFANSVSGVSGVVSSSNSLVGSTANDQVGSEGVSVLSNGNYVVRSSSYWDGAAQDVGAVTFGDGTAGIAGVISSANSLIGSRAFDRVGGDGVTVLTNGNYVVSSREWDNGAIQNVGAVTFASGTTGASGLISSSNSLIGSTSDDGVGGGGAVALTNGNYVVRSSSWDGAFPNVGAITFGNGTMGITGTVSTANSLVGSTTGDNIGGVTPLTNGNYVVFSSNWDNGVVQNVGAATFCNGTTGIIGQVSSTNSLVGSTTNDFVGNEVIALTNGNYVVRSSSWKAAASSVGAVTFGNGTTGISGTVTSSNSLVGSTSGDNVGFIKPLTNGNYVVTSNLWDNLAVEDAGAVTFGNGTTGVSGVVSPSNSLVGSMAFDYVGRDGVTALSNGNYVVINSYWDGTAEGIGAATFGNGTTGISGVISSSNSLVGSTAGDSVGYGGVIALTNGNYVVISTGWTNGSVISAGAVTFGNGTNGVTGEVTTSNSLVGSTAFDNIGGIGRVAALTNGNYVVTSQSWDGAASNVGAVTFGNGTTGISGVISSSNSLVGSVANDQVGSNVINVLPNGNYIVRSPLWDNGAFVNAGAVSYMNGNTGNFAPVNINSRSSFPTQKAQSPDDSFGAVTVNNSVRGTVANGGSSLIFSYDTANNQLVVGRPSENMVTLFSFAPTAASVTVAGEVQTENGRGISRARVTITDSTGQIRTLTTNQFGYYQFEDVAIGETYVFNVGAKGYSFVPQVLNITEDIKDLNFTAQ